MIHNLLKAVLKLTTFEIDSSKHLHCKLHKIPTPYSSKMNCFYTDFKTWLEVTNKGGYKLVVEVDNLSAYNSSHHRMPVLKDPNFKKNLNSYTRTNLSLDIVPICLFLILNLKIQFV